MLTLLVCFLPDLLGDLLQNGSTEEVEIRGATIWTVEVISISVKSLIFSYATRGLQYWSIPVLALAHWLVIFCSSLGGYIPFKEKL